MDKQKRFTWPLLLALALHFTLLGLFALSALYKPKQKEPEPVKEIIHATMIDTASLQAEAEAVKKAKEAKKQAINEQLEAELGKEKAKAEAAEQAKTEDAKQAKAEAAKQAKIEAAEEVGGMWYRFAHFVADHAVVCLVSALVILSILASPMLDLKLGFADDGDAPTSLTQRRAYDLITTGFGTGANGPLLVAMALPNPTTQNEATTFAAVEKVATALGATPNVASVTPPIPSPTNNAAIILVTPKTAPNAAPTQALVKALRSTTIPAATNGTVLANQVFVGGQTATLIDVDHRIGERLLLCIGAVILAAFLLLMMVFRSVLVPLTAAVLNMFSIAAAYGVIVAVFQWGWARSLIGLDQAVPIVAFIPLMMFAILFGLSMDYEVFLLSRVREEYLKSGDSREAVAIGVAKTARVITAAAMIMIAVFLSFVLSPEPTLKMMGIGMAAAVLVDATVVRLLLVPASMQMLGNATWWLPRWLDRILPHLNIEGHAAPAEPAVRVPVHMSVQGVGVESVRTEADSTSHTVEV